MNSGIEERPEWVEAGVKLTSATKALMDKGSIGATEFVHQVRPLWKRYEGGERTQQLLELINQLSKGHL